VSTPRRLSAGVVPVRRYDEGWRYLLLRAYRYWDFPKGEPESGESPLAAALRELAEETTLVQVRFPWGQQWYETEPYRGGKVARYYLAEVPSGEPRLLVSPELGRPEHQELRWLSAADAGPLLVPRLQTVLRWAVATMASDAAVTAPP